MPPQEKQVKEVNCFPCGVSETHEFARPFGPSNSASYL